MLQVFEITDDGKVIVSHDEALSRPEVEMREEVTRHTAAMTVIAVLLGLPLMMLFGINRPLVECAELAG